jgi:hypothetical protein
MHPSLSSEAREAFLGKDALRRAFGPTGSSRKRAAIPDFGAARRVDRAESHDSLSTLRTRSAVFFAPIFCMMLARWNSTVRVPILSTRPISLLEAPRTI